MNKYKIKADKIAEICNGTIIGNKETLIENYSNDTRKINKDDMYIAIKGDKIDGNDFIEEAFEKGAIGCIIDKDLDGKILQSYKDKIIIKVENTIEAIQKIAEYKRSLYNIPVVAVTGSVGKTSTKDIIASVLSQKFNVLKTEGNLNNHIGLPLTLLKLKDQNAVVVEMGMNHFGEISVLTNIAKPTICAITNIGSAHIGNLGSRENILKAKLEILEGLSDNGTVVINNDNDLLSKWVSENKEYNICTYGIKNNSNYIAKNITEKENENIFDVDNVKARVPMGGEHFIYNALCAFSIGKLLDISEEKIIKGINEFSLTSNRMDIQKIQNNVTIINDSYNANLDSMKATISVLSKMQAKRKIAVLGNMFELGEYTEQIHEKVGKFVAENNIDILITVGEYAKYISTEARKNNMKEIYICEDIEETARILNNILQENDLVLLKASNAMNFSRIIKLINN